MKKLLFVGLLLVSFNTFGQTNVKKNYTAPFFQGSVKVEDTLGVANKLLVDTIGGFSSSNIIISDTVTFLTNMAVKKIFADTIGASDNTKQIYLDSASFLKFVEFLNKIKAEGLTINGDADISQHMAIGANATIDNDFVLNINDAITSSNSVQGIQSTLIYTPTNNTRTGVGSDITIIMDGAVGGSDVMGASISATNAVTAGTSPNLIGLRLQVATSPGAIAPSNTRALEILGPVFIGANPTNLEGINIANQGNAGVTTSAAINIEDQIGSTTNKAIKTGTGLVEFGDDVTIAGSITTSQLNSDNLRLDGNTLSSEDVNGLIKIIPNGTGRTEVIATPGTAVGGFASGGFHVTSPSASVNGNSVITGHNSFGGNKQLWYFGSTSSSNDNIAFINRQTGSISFLTGGVNQVIIEDDGLVSITNDLTVLGTTVLDNNAANTSAIVTFENTAGDVQLFRTDATPENSITGSIGDLAVDGTNGFFYIKKSGLATNTGWQITGGASTFKSYSLSNPGSAGTFYVGGHYAFDATDANLTIGGTVIQTFGTAGQAHGAHAFAVASGAGGTDLVLTVTGVSITDAGVRNDADSEILVADVDLAITDQYFETSKKWLGQITYTLTGATGTFDFNYGFVKYEDYGNKDFTVTDFEGTGQARANETGLNIELLHHEATAFVYNATAFVPNQTALVSLATDYGTNNDVANGDGFAYKRNDLSTAVNGNNGEGLIIRVTTVVNNSINDASFQIGVTLK